MTVGSWEAQVLEKGMAMAMAMETGTALGQAQVLEKVTEMVMEGTALVMEMEMATAV